MDCLFCKIIAGEIPSYRVYEDEFVYAFLDINPTSRGHTVVVPKIHFERFTEMDPEDAGHLFRSVSQVARGVEQILSVPGSNIGINNGQVAGQVVPHVHVHIIPRREGDNGGSMHSIVSAPGDISDLEELADMMREIF